MTYDKNNNDILICINNNKMLIILTEFKRNSTSNDKR